MDNGGEYVIDDNGAWANKSDALNWYRAEVIKLREEKFALMNEAYKADGHFDAKDKLPIDDLIDISDRGAIRRAVISGCVVLDSEGYRIYFRFLAE